MQFLKATFLSRKMNPGEYICTDLHLGVMKRYLIPDLLAGEIHKPGNDCGTAQVYSHAMDAIFLVC